MTKNILITGAASGLGKALAQLYANIGFNVLIVDIQDEIGQAFVEKLQSEGKSAQYYHCNLDSKANIDALFEQIKSDYSYIDILINNAGVASAGTLEQSNQEEWQRLINLDLMSVVYVSKACLPLLKKLNSAHIVNIASFAGLANFPAMMTYNVAKAAVIAFSETLLVELSPYNIGVSVACPAFFQTNLVDSMPDASKKTKDFVQGQMQSSKIKADDVASDIAKAVENHTFMVISHKQAKRQYLFKRLFPTAFLNKKIKLYQQLLNK